MKQVLHEWELSVTASGGHRLVEALLRTGSISGGVQRLGEALLPSGEVLLRTSGFRGQRHEGDEHFLKGDAAMLERTGVVLHVIVIIIGI